MKKKIGFICLDSSLTGWLLEKLRLSPPDTPAAQELRQGLSELLDGTANSLMLELGEEEISLPVSDTIRCGELSIDPRLRRVIRDGREIPLTPKEFDILYFLARNRGGCSPRSRSTRRCGRATICWTTATSWRSSASCARKSSRTPTHPNIYAPSGASAIPSTTGCNNTF